MRNSILGFSQAKVMNLTREENGKTIKLDMDDLLLLNYIQNALSRHSMEHISDEYGITYIWLKHSKILEDLPILNFGLQMLKKKLDKLVWFGLITATILRNKSGKGSKAYYTITPEVEKLQFDYDDTNDKKVNVVDEPTIKNYGCSEVPTIKNYMSNNKLKNNNSTNKLVENNNKNLSKDKLEKKPNLYSKCSGLINEFTEDEHIRELLFQYLDALLANYKDMGKTFYTNSFKGKLNRLKDLPKDDWAEIIVRTLDNGWINLFPLDEKKPNAIFNEDDKIKQKRFIEDLKKNGKRVVF